MSTPITEKGWYYNHVNASAENTLQGLQTPEVRDLAWACFSPPLFHAPALASNGSLDNCAFPLTAARQQWLMQLDERPGPLRKFIAAAKSTRLGIYFESLWQFFLQGDPQVDLLASNLAVRDGGTTLGEFDLVYFCHRRQRHVHLELALKFYLCAPGLNGSEWRHWLGANSRDRLDLKLGRMLNHQTRLSEQPQAAEVLAGLGVKSVLRELEVKGRLYQQHGRPALAPPAYNRRKSFHGWVYAGEAQAVLDSATSHRLTRRQWLAPQWLAPQRLAPMDPAPSDTGLEQTAGQPRRAQQFAVFDETGREQQRLMVVTDNWPQTHE